MSAKRRPGISAAAEMAAFSARSLGSSEAATFVVAVDGTIVSWSPEAEALFGWPAWAAVGRRCHEVVAGRNSDGSPACCAECPARLEARLGVPPPSYDLLVTAPFRGAQPRFLRTHHVPLRDPAGYVAGLLHVVDADVRSTRSTRRAAG